MIHGGFRDRWQRQGLARQLDSENDQLDDLQQGLFDGCLEDQMGSADESWNHVGFADGVGSPAFDAVNQSTAHMSFMDDSRSFSMTPKPKSRPQISSSSSSVTLGIKRTADEFALHSLHRQMSVLKRPGQKGPQRPSFPSQRRLGKDAQQVLTFLWSGWQTIFLPVTQQLQSRNKSDRWRQLCKVSGRLGLLQQMMITDVCHCHGTRPWFCLKWMLQGWVFL